MSLTTFETSNPLRKIAFEEKILREAIKDSFFDRFTSTKENSIVQLKTNLEKDYGDKIQFGLVKRLAGDGVEGDAILEGNEEALSTYDYDLSLNQYRHAVRDKGRLSSKRPMFSVSEVSKERLKGWASEKIDKLHFEAAGLTSASNDPAVILYPNAASGAFSGKTSYSAALADANPTNSKLTPNFIMALKAWAKTGGNYSQNPIAPIKVDGRDHWVLLVNPDNLYDLKTDSNFRNSMLYAQERGKDNPLFRGAVAVWDDIIIHEHVNCYATSGSGSGAVTTPYAKCALLGQQALLFAMGRKEEIVQETFDYQNQIGHGWSIIAKAGRPRFNSKDYGMVGVFLARSSIIDTTIS